MPKRTEGIVRYPSVLFGILYLSLHRARYAPRGDEHPLKTVLQDGGGKNENRKEAQTTFAVMKSSKTTLISVRTVGGKQGVLLSTIKKY